MIVAGIKNYIFIFYLFSLIFIVSHPASASSTTIDKKVSETPRRIVSLSPAITEELYLLGLEAAIVGVTTYCQKPDITRKKKKVGSVIEPDIEKIVSFKPDLVVAMNLTSMNVIRKLKDLGIHVVVFAIPKNFEELCRVFLQLGKEVGKEDTALKLVNTSKKRVLHTINRTNTLPKQKVLVQIGAKPFFVATKDYLINDYIEMSGGINIFKNAPSGAVAREVAIQRNPDVIIMTAMGLSGDDEGKIWKRFGSIRAVKENRVHFIDPDSMCSPTPVSFAELLEKIVHILHPMK